jgi:hypothetical protein
MKPDERICDIGEGGEAFSAGETASNALTELVRLLARQAAGEAFAEATKAAASPASHPIETEAEDGQTG